MRQLQGSPEPFRVQRHLLQSRVSPSRPGVCYEKNQPWCRRDSPRLGGQDSLGNLEAKRDWGYAPEYVELMWGILQHQEAGDFVGATGEAHSVRKFVAEAFRIVDIEDWEAHITIDKRHFRPAEVYNLRGDASKAKNLLGWKPKSGFRDLVQMMVRAAIELLEVDDKSTRGPRGRAYAVGKPRNTPKAFK